jgi:hypothetical protein
VQGSAAEPLSQWQLTCPFSSGPLTPSLIVALMGMSGSSRVGHSSHVRLGDTTTVPSIATVVRL